MTRACLDCPSPIKKGSTGRCKPCAARINGRRNGDKVPDPIPEDFAEFAVGKPLINLARHYGKCRRTVQRWRAQLEMPERVGRGAPPPSRPLPDDFATVAVGKTVAELSKHYVAGHRTVERWLSQAGVARTVTKRTNGPNPMGVLTLVQRDHRDYTQAGQAADYLRRLSPLTRCDPAGRYDANGTCWRRGSTVLTAGDVIARAERQGWVADAWRRVAA